MNIRELASLAGVSKTTAAYALQNNLRVSKKTRDKVHAMAKAHGYTTSPAIKSFMREVRKGKISSHRHTLAYISSVDPDNQPRRFRHGNEKELLRGAQCEAEALGCDLDIIDWDLKTASQVRLSQIIEARGIQGIFLGSAIAPHTKMDLDWNNVAVISSGYTVENPPMDRIAADLFSALFDAGQRAIERDYQKLIIATDDHGNERVGWRWLSAAATLRELHGDRIQVLRGSPAELAREISNKYRKQTAVFGHGALHHELKASGAQTSQKMAFVGFDLNPSEPEVTAIVQPHFESGRRAIRHLHQAVENGVFGIPEHPCRLAVTCGWNEGKTLSHLRS